ncbi:MAG TPA: DUF2330 domain-containing protein [Verrucomicrobiota bacterium]|nr:DUF2330 domain-containing protein [Verrucomicrobiota bacterium]
MLWLFSVLLGVRTFADGKVFPSVAYPLEVRIPDQRALLWWSNGVERLIVETRFTGQGTNFAWVVPLPAVPKVEAASPGLFPTLTLLLRPKVIHAPTGWWRFGLFLAGLLWLLLTVRTDGQMRWSDWLAVIAMAFGATGSGIVASNLFGVLVGVIGAFGAYKARTSGIKLVHVSLIILLLVLVAGFLLPSLATAKAGGSSEQVEILDRQLVGAFDSTTITGKDAGALRSWLNTNGYALPPATEPVIADYLREGWVFVASKVRRNQSRSETNSLHPLSFTFAAKAPVYPLRLTGVGNGNLEVDLFVLGPERAQANGFIVRDCRQPDYPLSRLAEDESWYPQPETLPMVHEGLRQVAPHGAYVTRLEGRLTSRQMRDDAVIHWDGTSEVRDVRYSAHGAWVSSINWTVNAFCLFVVGVAVSSRVRGQEAGRYFQSILIAGMVAAITTGLFYSRLSVVPVTMEKPWVRRTDAKNQQLLIRMAIMDELDTNAPVTLEAVRVAIQRGLPFHLAQYSKNVRRIPTFQIREEDSPYNYSLRGVSNGVELLLYDQIGRAAVHRIPE